MVEPCKEKIIFISTYGNSKFIVMNFVFMSAPLILQRMVNVNLPELKLSRVSLDDIAIFSTNVRHHVVHLKKTFGMVAEARLITRPFKCLFALSKVKLGGHTATATGVAGDTEKIAAIENAPVS